MKVSKNIIPFLVSSIICVQNPIWPLWKNGLGIWIGYLLIVLLLFILKERKYNFSKFSVFVLFFSFWTFLVCPLRYSLPLSNIFILLAYLSAQKISSEEFKKALSYVTTFLSVIVTISLPMWLINTFVYELPIMGQLDLSQMKGAEYVYNNYIFFVTDVSKDYMRFYSMFDEPGVLGTFSAFVLFGNRYKFNYKNSIILLGAIFTYSMAFYILTLIGVMFYSMTSIKKMLILLFSLLSITYATYYFLKDDLAFNYAVISRIDSFGIDQIENRTDGMTNKYWEKFVSSNDLYWGLGSKRPTLEGQSYKLFIIEYGIQGSLVLFLMYIVLMRKFNKFTLCFFLIFILSFLQRPFAFRAWQIFLFSCVIAELSSRNILLYKKTYENKGSKFFF